MSDFEDGQPLQRAHLTGARSPASAEKAASQYHPMTPLKEVPEQEEEEEQTAGARNNNSIMGKVKKRVSSILPAALSGWFSPSSKPGAASLHQQEQQRQPNGRSKRKRGRRRIVLAEADAEADDVDDGSDARGLNYEEVALADNIAEHDLAAEDEQTRRSEYNVFLLRRQRDALAANTGEEDDVEEEEEDEEEEDDEEEEEEEQQEQPKRRRLELETTAVNLPHMRRLPLGSSTPAASLVAASSSSATDSLLAPHRRTHLNLYGNQRNREPAFNFFTGNEAAAEGTTGDLPHSIRRLNIPFGGGGGGSSSSSATNLSISSLLPSHKRPPLLAKRTERLDMYNLLMNMNSGDTKNINNNNNNVEKITTTDSHSEGDLQNYQDDGLRPSSRHNSNSHLEFYGNLQSAKSLFNRSSVTGAQPTLHNSTWSLNSLSKRRKFNASIYGSTSALSDSRLLSHSASGSSASASSSPFYQGRTAFGGNSANNRFFNRSSSAASSLLAINSGGSSPVHPASGSLGYNMKPVEMRPSQPVIPAHNATSGGRSNSNLSSATQRILHLLDSYSTPLIDAKRMGSTLKEHQNKRNAFAYSSAGSSSPYTRPYHTQNSSSSDLAELRSNKLLLPTMQQLLERRRLNRVTNSSRQLMQSQSQSQKNEGKAATTTDSVPSEPQQPAPTHSHHTNKMRSKLSHQTRGKETRQEEAAPPPLDLPQISFPDMASTPKFDLVIPKTKPQAVAPASAPSKSHSNSSTSSKPNFLVNPQPLSVANGNVAGVIGKRYSFVEPTPLQPAQHSSSDSSPIRRNYSFPAPAPLEELVPVAVVNGLPPQGFGEQFKKSGQEWECEVCMVRNKAEISKCVACETPKPSKVAKVTPVPVAGEGPSALLPLSAGGFGDRFKKSSSAWECDACMLSNKEEATKCIACETPRKTAKTSKTSINSFPLSAVSGFGDAFKPAPGRWECQTCMVMNDSSSVECVACQTPNPRASTSSTTTDSSSSNSSSSTSSSSSASSPCVSSVSSSTSFKFGFAPKQDAGFQQLVAAQKAASWDCDACMAQNDMSRSKCICCEQLKPGGSATSVAISLSSSSSSGSNSTLPAAGNSVPKFSFGFAPLQKAKEQEPAKAGFTFGQQEQTKAEETKETKASSSTEAVAPAPAPATAPAPAPTPALTPSFVFRAPTTSSTASSSTTSTPALAAFSFGAPPSSSSTVSSSTANSSINSMPAAKPMFSFSGAGTGSAVSSTSSQQPAAKAVALSFGVSSNTITTTTSSTGFALAPAAAAAPALSFGASAAPATAPTPAAAPQVAPPAAPAAPPAAPQAAPQAASQAASQAAPQAAPAPAPAATFSFGSQAAKTVSTPVAAGNFFFGQPPAGAPGTLGTVNTSVSSIFGASAVSTSTAAASSSMMSNSTMVSSAATSNPLLFSFGGGEKKPETTPAPSAATKPFLFGSGSGATTTPMPSFGWPSNGATGMSNSMSSAVTSSVAVSSSQGIMMAEPIFASSAMFAAPSSTSSSLFGSTATTAAAATPATVFGNVGNSLVAPIATAAATPAPSPLANIFGNPNPMAAAAPSNVFGSGAGGGGGGFGAANTAVVQATTKPAFNFGGAAAVAGTPSGSPFNFGSSTAGPAKPTFNFTGSVTASTPQAGAFNFSANPTATPLAAGESAPNANAPFQFSAGAPAPANIFAFNQPTGQSTQNSQIRRKVRTPMRRLPPR